MSYILLSLTPDHSSLHPFVLAPDNVEDILTVITSTPVGYFGINLAADYWCIPFVVGLWLPLSFGLIQATYGGNTLTMLISGAYSAIAWLLLGITVYVRTDNKIEEKIVEPIALN